MFDVGIDFHGQRRQPHEFVRFLIDVVLRHPFPEHFVSGLQVLDLADPLVVGAECQQKQEWLVDPSHGNLLLTILF